MTHDELQEYIPHYGDRLAVYDFARQKSPQSKDNEKHKTTLFESLKEKFKLRNKESTETAGPSTENVTPKSLKKLDRKRDIKLSLFNYDVKKERYVQICTSGGGGTRKIKVEQS